MLRINGAVRAHEHKIQRRGAISSRFSIKMIEIPTRKETFLSVLAYADEAEVTEDMVKEQVAALNTNCGLSGSTAHKLEKRFLAFRLEILQ